MQVKRITVSCCGMHVGEIYEAEWISKDLYIKVRLPSGEWTSHHYFPGFFEVLNDITHR